MVRVRARVGLMVALALSTLVLVPVDRSAAEPVGHHLTGLDIVGWGRASEDQLEVPLLPPGASVIDVAAGSAWSLALLSDGTVRQWGRRSSTFSVPESLAGKRVVAVAAGEWDAIALTADGTVTTWGFWAARQRPLPAELEGETVVAVSMSDDHALALTARGRVVAWGDDDHGATVVPVGLADARVTAISAGYDQSLALTEDGDVVAWGDNSRGQALPPPGGAETEFTAISAGYHNAALTSAGQVVTWGAGAYGADLPASATGSTMVAVSAGLAWTLALDTEGRLHVWGPAAVDTPDAPMAVPEDVVGRTVTAFTVSLGPTALVATLGRFTDTEVEVTGEAQVGRTLTATPRSTPAPEATAVRWLRDGTPIAGATGPSYVVGREDAGSRVQAEATLERSMYDAAHPVSTATAPIATAVMPGTLSAAVTGRAVVGSTLTATTTSTGLPTGAATTWQWRRDGEPVASTGPEHLLTIADRGHRMSATATVRAQGYTSRTASSQGTAAVRLPALTLGVSVTPARQRRGKTFVVSSRLLAGEVFAVRLSGRLLTTGRATSSGSVSRRLTVPAATPLGVRRLVVTGSQPDRTGSQAIRILRRR